MGRDKALLELAGKPLVLHAVTKLKRLCAEVSVLSNNPELTRYGRLVPDLHEGCGPLGGIEAALRDSTFEWNLILPVDLPFLPTIYLDDWLWSVLHKPIGNIKLSILAVDGTRHPALLLIHREMAPYLTDCLEREELKLFPALLWGSDRIAAGLKVRREKVFVEMQWDDPLLAPAAKDRAEPWCSMTEAQKDSSLWFANLNTPEEFAEAERHVDALDT
jgi:molybdopterin-guanine dinucleotide biosynthesis protein A